MPDLWWTRRDTPSPCPTITGRRRLCRQPSRSMWLRNDRLPRAHRTPRSTRTWDASACAPSRRTQVHERTEERLFRRQVLPGCLTSLTVTPHGVCEFCSREIDAEREDYIVGLSGECAHHNCLVVELDRDPLVDWDRFGQDD